MIFRLFEDIKLVKGYNRAAVLDLTREEIKFIPLFLADELEQLNGTENYKTQLAQKYPTEYNSFIDFIETHEIGLELTPTENANFPPLETTWTNAAALTNAIVEVSSQTDTAWVRKLEELGCRHLELRVVDTAKLQTLLDELLDSTIKSIALVFNTEPPNLTALLDVNPRVIETHIFNAALENNGVENAVYYHTMAFENRPVVPQNSLNLTVNRAIYTEALTYNTYLNRKLFIAANGDLKNAPESAEILGNLKNLTDTKILKTRVKQLTDQKINRLTKSEIDVCRVCEFRLSCVCNRIPKQRENNTWFYEQECHYNPYISTWRFEPNYKNLTQCGVVSNGQTLTVNEEKLDQINAKIWP